MFLTKCKLSLSTGLLTSAAFLMVPGMAVADTTAAETANTAAMDNVILVTARKRVETLTDVPLSMQSFSMEEIEKSGVDNLQELSRFTPSLNFVNGSQGQGGRTISEVRFRGLSTALPTPTNQTGSVFIDGVYVLGGAQSVGFEDIERVEVIKGPQSAYFGRATFAGVVNYITRDPSDVFGGQFSANYSPSFGSYGLSGGVEGPLVADILTGRISASVRQKGAQYTASDGGELGRERTEAITATFVLRPSDALKIKLRGGYSEDNDGAAAVGYYAYNGNGNCAVGTPITVKTTAGLFDTSLRKQFQCGEIKYNGNLVDQNTALLDFPAINGMDAVSLYDVLVRNSTGDPLLAKAPKLERIGLTRQMIRLSGALDYEVSDAVSFSALTGYNKQEVNNIRDTDGTPRPAGFQAVPFAFEDFSFESRVSYDPDTWFRGSVGVNYFQQKIEADTDNGVSVTPERVVGNGVERVVTSSSNNENDKVKTWGFFAGVDIEPVEWMTVTLEGRYQIDDYTKFAGSNAGGNLIAETLRSKNFTPRAIVKFTPVHDMTLYGSYSIGVLPGTVNTRFLALSPAEQAQVLAIYPDLPVKIGSEKLTNYEVGYKQYFSDLRLQLSLSLFHMKWENLKGTSALIIPDWTQPIFSVTTPGTAEINGFEFEGNWQATDNLSFRASAGYLDSKYKDYSNTSYNSYFGIPAGTAYKADGNKLPRNPSWSGAFSTTWVDQLIGEWDYRVRGDVMYVGKQYVDESNITSLPAYTTVNLTLGVENESVAVDFYVTNLFNERAWLSGRRFIDVSAMPLDMTVAGQGAFLTPTDKREIGVNLRYKF